MIYPVPGFPGSFYSSEDDVHVRIRDYVELRSGVKIPPPPPPSEKELTEVAKLRELYGPRK